MPRSSSTIAAALLAVCAASMTSVSAVSFGNHVHLYGLPSDSNGGVWFKGQSADVVFCFNKQAPSDNVEDYSFEFRRNMALDKQASMDPEKGEGVRVLTADEFARLTGKEACRKVAETTDVEAASDMAPVDEENTLVDEQGDLDETGPMEEDVVAAMMAELEGNDNMDTRTSTFDQDRNNKFDQESDAFDAPPSRLHKRGLMSWSFVKDGGLLTDVDEELMEAGKCFHGKFSVPEKMKSGQDYKFAVRVRRNKWFGHKEFKGPHVFVLNAQKPKTVQPKSVVQQCANYLDNQFGNLAKTPVGQKTSELAGTAATATGQFLDTAGEASYKAYDATKKSMGGAYEASAKWTRSAYDTSADWTRDSWNKMTKKQQKEQEQAQAERDYHP